MVRALPKTDDDARNPCFMCFNHWFLWTFLLIRTCIIPILLIPRTNGKYRRSLQQQIAPRHTPYRRTWILPPQRALNSVNLLVIAYVWFCYCFSPEPMGSTEDPCSSRPRQGACHTGGFGFSCFSEHFPSDLQEHQEICKADVEVPTADIVSYDSYSFMRSAIMFYSIMRAYDGVSIYISRYMYMVFHLYYKAQSHVIDNNHIFGSGNINFKADMKSFKQRETTAIFLWNFYLKTGIGYVYVTVHFICIWSLVLQRTQSKREILNEKFLQWESNPVPSACKTDALPFTLGRTDIHTRL